MSHQGTQQVARAASILFHPAVVMVVATGVAADTVDRAPDLLWQALGFAAGVAAVMMLYSAWQARSGRWSHIDASRPSERSQLNRFASSLLLGLAGLLALVDAHRDLVIGIGLSGLIVLASYLLRRWLKSSLHAAFAAFAMCIVWPQALAFGGLLLVTLVVAWSRLALRRHDLWEVLGGRVIGLMFGVVFQVLTS